MPDALCYINNKFQRFSEAKLHVSDLGLQRGFAIFDYFLEVEGRIPFFDDYLDRFYRSADIMNLEIPLRRELMKEKIHYLLQQNKFQNSGIKLLLTGGYSDDLYSPGVPNFIILNLELKGRQGEEEKEGKGERLLLLDFQRHIPEVKTTFYLPSIALFPKMKEYGAIEVLYHHNGLISETTRANFFMIKNGVLITAASGVLKGITRKYVLQVAREMMPVEEREVRLEEIWNCDEAFITGTSKHVLPIVEIEGQTIGNGKPGKLTLAVSEAFERFFNGH